MTKTPSIISQIVELLYAQGGLSVSEMCKTIKYPYKSVYTKALELRKLNLADKNDNGIWFLREGVTPSTLETGVREENGDGDKEDTEEEADSGEEGKNKAPMVRSNGVPLDQRGLFIQELKNIGVTPKEVIPTIASIFFDGDIDDLNWLNMTLLKSAAGWVNHKQRRLIIDWWSHSRGLPYMTDEFFPDKDEDRKLRKAVEDEKPAKPERRMDPGLGWKLDKDRDGDWMPIPGGPMSYQEAVDSAKERQMISAYSRGNKPDTGDEEFDEGTPVRKGGKKQETILEYMMKKMVDNMLESKGKDGDSETVRKLTERIETMEAERQEQRFERLEGMIAQAASRDPWEDYDRIQAMKERLGVGGPVVTDQSPAVQLIKDSTEKMDKNISRLMGIIERTALRSDEFTPETTRTTGQREEKAGALLETVTGREHSRGLRRDTFGI